MKMNNNIDDNQCLPEQLSIDYYEDYMHLRYDWRNRRSIMAIIFTVFWVFMMGIVFYGNFDKFLRNTELIPFLLIFAGATIFIIYYTIAHWFNKTDIFVNIGEMEVKISPVPWYGSTKVQTSNIAQFDNKRRVKGSKEKQRVSFEVHYVLANNTDRKLLVNLTTRDQAAYIEQKIEQYLDIKNDEDINKDDYDYLSD